MRSSSYNIVSRPNTKTGDTIVLNGIIGSMELVSPAISKELMGYDPAQSRLPKELVHYFTQRGYITTRTIEQEQDILTDVAHAVHTKLVERPHFLILPQLDCNFRCSYCYEKPRHDNIGRGDACGMTNTRMDSEQVRSAFDAIEELVKAHGSVETSPDLILYGGEPLDSELVDTVQNIVEQSEQRGYCLGAVTNGYDLDCYTHLLGPNKINNLQITIDGPSDVHEKRRRVRKSSRDNAAARGRPPGSFDAIVQNIDELLEIGTVDIQLRINVDSANIDSIDALLSDIESRGWLQHDRFLAYASIVYRKNEKGHIYSDLSQAELYERLAKHARRYLRFIVNGHTGNRGLILKLAMVQASTAQLRPVFCGANMGMYIFAPDNGRLFWHRVGFRPLNPVIPI